MSMKEWLDVFQSSSVILASVVAVYSINAWRREFVGKRRIELAEEVLALFYHAQDVVESIRSSFGYEGEGRSRKPGPNERPEDKEALDQAHVLIERYNRHAEVFSQLRALRYRFMAQFGADAAKPFDDLSRLINELLFAARRKARLAIVPERTLQSEAALEKHHQEWVEVDRIYYSGDADDPIAPRLVKIRTDIESTCRPHHRKVLSIIGCDPRRVSVRV